MVETSGQTPGIVGAEGFLPDAGKIEPCGAGGEKAESEKMLGQMLSRQLGRHIEPVEVGRVVAFLLSDAAKIIRGQSISIDGGDTPF